MKVDRKLNLVMTLDRADGSKAFVHAQPISYQVFEAHFMTLSRAYARMEVEGGAWMLRMGPRTAALLLKEVAQQDGSWDAPGGVQQALLPEMRRLANVVLPAEAGGWQTRPLQELIDKKLMEEEEGREVDNVLAFFMLCSACQPKKQTADMLELIAGMLGMQATSLSATEWSASLMTSTQAESTGEKGTPSSIPG